MVRRNTPVAMAIDRVRAFHREGCESLRLCDRLPYGRTNTATSVWPHLKVASATETLRRARRFARAYPQDACEGLLTRSATAGVAITIEHCVQLVAVPKRQRRRFENDMLRRRWSAGELRRQIKKQLPIRPEVAGKHAGRRLQVWSVDDLKLELSDSYRRMTKVVAAAMEPRDDGSRPPFRQLRPADRRALAEAMKQFGKIMLLRR